jgi:four helix bundle protein
LGGVIGKFRFEDLDIWKKSIEVTTSIFCISEKLDKKRLYRWAEQLRGSCLSISNNIAEGSGSFSKKEFVQFLNFSRRSTFETANILIILKTQNLVEVNNLNVLINNLDSLSRMITNFIKSLRS